MRHDQRNTLANSIKCNSCREYNCKKCIDVGRKVAFGQGVIELCNCDHSEQFTGTQ